MSAPAVFAVVPLLIGVVAGALGSLPPPPLLWLLGACWCVSAFSLAGGRSRLFMAAFACGQMAAGGVLGTIAERVSSAPPLLETFKAEASDGAPVRLVAVLREDASVTPFGVSVPLDVRAIVGKQGETPTRGGIRASIVGALARGRAKDWRQGRTIRLDAQLREPADFRNVGTPSDRERLARQGIVLSASVKSAALVSVVARGSPVAEIASSLRAWVRRTTGAAVGRWSQKSAGIVTAILIGDRSGLDPEDERRLQEAGTYHVIAISGGNIALLTVLLLGVARALGLSPRRAAAVSIVSLAFYGYMAGLAPSVMRATLAGLVYLIARVIDHRGSAMNALGVAGGIAAVTTPMSVLDPGFVLSFGATVAIVAAATPLTRAITPDRRRSCPGVVAKAGRLPTGSPAGASAKAGALAKAGFAVKALSAATICAEIALAPVGARLFGRISVAGLLLNFAAIPLMSVIQVAGLLAVCVSTVSAAGASVPGWIAHVSAVALIASASLVDVFPWTVVEVAAPAAWVIALWYFGWGILYLVWRRVAVRAIGFAAIAFSASAMVWSPPSARAALLPAPLPGWSRIVFIDVGQGDATLIQPPHAAPLLIDAGGVPGSSFDVGRRVTMPALWGLGIRDLGALVVTHGDPDHMGGAGAVLRAVRTREVWEGIPVPYHQPLRELRALAIRRGTRWRELRSGDDMPWGAARLRVLNPPPPDWERRKVRNDDSIVLEVRIGRVAIILPGDISQAVEPDVAARLTHAAGDVTIVKAPHHGSAGSSSEAFIAATRPAAVIFSAGRRNPFGHPAAATLARYATAGARIFRTDEDGEVILDTDGDRVVVWTWGGRREEIGLRR